MHRAFENYSPQMVGALVDVPTEGAINAQLHRIVASEHFDRSDRLKRFLLHIVRETLEGRPDRLKAYCIATEVFGREASFDAQNDPVVRIEAGRLRREIERYYLTEGQADPVLIDVPKGSYVPHFSYRHSPPPAHDAPIGDVVEEDPPQAGQRRSSRINARWILIPAALACLLGAMWVGGQISRAAELSDTPSLLVLPFANLGGNADTGLHAAGISEELSARLVRFKELAIVATDIPDTSSSKRAAIAGRADYLLDGSVRAIDGQLRVAARLVDQRSATVIWSEIFDVDLSAKDLLALEADIATRVATAVAQPYGVIFRTAAQKLDKPSTEVAAAYRCALEFYQYRTILSAELHGKVRQCLQHTVAHGPGNATAWAMLSYAYLDEERFGFNRMSDVPAIARAVAAARRAVALDPTNVRALQALMTALFFNQEPNESLRIGEQAFALNPNDTELLGEFGSRLVQAGQIERGSAMIEDALARNPGNSGYYAGMLALAAYLRGEDRKAIVLIQRADTQRFPIYHVVAAMIYARGGLLKEAEASRLTFLAMRPGFFDNLDAELAKRNFRPEDRAILTEGARRAGFPVPALVQ